MIWGLDFLYHGGLIGMSGHFGCAIMGIIAVMEIMGIIGLPSGLQRTSDMFGAHALDWVLG